MKYTNNYGGACMPNNILNYELKNIKGKVAVISEEADLSFALLSLKNIRDSEIDIYIQSGNGTVLIKDIKDSDYTNSSDENSFFKYNVSEIFSPFEYTCVILICSSSEFFKIAAYCKAMATPVITKTVSENSIKIA